MTIAQVLLGSGKGAVEVGVYPGHLRHHIETDHQQLPVILTAVADQKSLDKENILKLFQFHEKSTIE